MVAGSTVGRSRPRAALGQRGHRQAPLAHLPGSTTAHHITSHGTPLATIHYPLSTIHYYATLPDELPSLAPSPPPTQGLVGLSCEAVAPSNMARPRGCPLLYCPSESSVEHKHAEHKAKTQHMAKTSHLAAAQRITCPSSTTTQSAHNVLGDVTQLT